MDPTEEAFVAQVREASIAQVTHVEAGAINSCLTQRASRGARRQLNPAESRRDGEKRSQFLWNRGCLILGTMWMWHCVCVDTASQCRRTSNLYVVWRKLGCPTVLTDACMSYAYDWPRHLSMTQCWEYRSVIYVRFACRLVRSTKVGSR